MTGIEKLRNLSATLGEGQPFTLEGIYIGGKTASEWLADVADQIERETLPRPRFEDGEPVQVGDEYVSKDGGVYRCDRYRVYQDGEFEMMTQTSPCCWYTPRFELGGKVERPEPPKVLDADGVEINVGDEVWMVEGDTDAWVVESMDGDRVEMTSGVGWYCNAPCSKLTHKRPEPEDTWEELEKCSKDPCEYFGGNKNCKECPVELGNVAWSCTKAMAKDLVRRCKALAGVD